VSHHQQVTYNIGLGVPYSAGVVIPNGIELLPIEEKRSGEVIRLVYHTTPHRGLELLVPVFERLVEVYPSMHLDVFSSFKAYGWASRDSDYEQLFDRCRKHPNINYHGYQPNDVVRAALQRAHVFAYPNIWPETSCIAAIEAITSGVAVVCPTFGALPETTGGLAYTYPFDENYNQHANVFAHVLLDVVRNYWSDTNVARRRFTMAWARGLYDWNSRAQQWVNLLRSIEQRST